MKVIIAGSRSIVDYAEVETAIRLSNFHITEVVSGGARGVDSLGELWAINNKVRLNNQQFRAMPWDWARDPFGAGKSRNERMAKYADALIAVWDGRSGGTKDMIERARAHGLLVYVYRVPLIMESEDVSRGAAKPRRGPDS